MSTITDSTPRSARRPTLARMMAAVAITAVLFGLLPELVSTLLAIVIWGVIIIDAMRLPIITDGEGPRRWLPWVVWLLAQFACPVAAGVVADLNPYSGPPPGLSTPLPWAFRVVKGLSVAQTVVSVVAAVAVPLLTRGIGRLSAWGVIVLIWVVAAFQFLGALMSTSGIYL